jgi:hypothetical protein
MQLLNKRIFSNPYIGNSITTVFTVMLGQTLYNNPTLFKLKNKKYVYSVIKYPKDWSKTTDIFKYIDKEQLSQIQKKDAYFIFDASAEGFCPIKVDAGRPISGYPFFDMLYYNCKTYNIDPSMIIYISSNLKDEENIKKYTHIHNVDAIHVFSFIMFEKMIDVQDKSADSQCEKSIKRCNDSHNDKLFSSLSRVNRPYRSLATFMLCQEDISSKALISHNRLKSFDPKVASALDVYSSKQITKWKKSLPLVVDRNDFNKNWAGAVSYQHIHDQTIFQIVNETMVHDYYKCSLFYSEKTFRPIAQFQPFVIYGQPGINCYLKEIGYKTYDEWFDLSFDEEEDPVIRYKKLLMSVKAAVSKLENMNKQEKIEWRFKNVALLKHNFNTMINSAYSKNKLVNFLETL